MNFSLLAARSQRRSSAQSARLMFVERGTDSAPTYPTMKELLLGIAVAFVPPLLFLLARSVGGERAGLVLGLLAVLFVLALVGIWKSQVVLVKRLCRTFVGSSVLSFLIYGIYGAILLRSLNG